MKRVHQSRWFIQLGAITMPCGTRTRAQRQFDSLEKERPATTMYLCESGPWGMRRIKEYTNATRRVQ